jgi:hypothetical protein
MKVIGKKPVFRPLEQHKFWINVHAVKKYLIIKLPPSDFRKFRHMPDRQKQKAQ